tara:strand:- start:342 stop:1127 length:786 start_codon:yes stop_codon:yes gene_type:complete
MEYSKIKSIAESICLQNGNESNLSVNELTFIENCCAFLKHIGDSDLKFTIKETLNKLVVFYANVPAMDYTQVEQLKLKSPSIVDIVFNISKKHLTIVINRRCKSDWGDDKKNSTQNSKYKNQKKRKAFESTTMSVSNQLVDYTNVNECDVNVIKKLVRLIEKMDDTMTEFDVDISSTESHYKIDFRQLPDFKFCQIITIKKTLSEFIKNIRFDFFNSILIFVVLKNTNLQNDTTTTITTIEKKTDDGGNSRSKKRRRFYLF